MISLLQAVLLVYVFGLIIKKVWTKSRSFTRCRR